MVSRAWRRGSRQLATRAVSAIHSQSGSSCAKNTDAGKDVRVANVPMAGLGGRAMVGRVVAAPWTVFVRSTRDSGKTRERAGTVPCWAPRNNLQRARRRWQEMSGML